MTLAPARAQLLPSRGRPYVLPGSFRPNALARSRLPLYRSQRPAPAHDFGRVQLAAQRAHTSSRQSTPSKRAEAFPDEARPSGRHKHTATWGGVVGGILGGLAGAAVGFLAGGPLGAVIGGVAGAAVGATAGHFLSGAIVLSGNSYDDSAVDSHKRIRFDAVLPLRDPTQYAMVNWIKGSMRDGMGLPFTVTMYGAVVPATFPAFQVDSQDTDPVYWSTPVSRWNYNRSAVGLWATDDPGPALRAEHGAVYDLDFKMALYRLADLPLVTAGGVGAASPITERPWRYSVVVDAAGNFTHP